MSQLTLAEIRRLQKVQQHTSETFFLQLIGTVLLLLLLLLLQLGSRVVSVQDSGAEAPGFKSQPRRCRVTVLHKLFTSIVRLFTKQQDW